MTARCRAPNESTEAPSTPDHWASAPQRRRAPRDARGRLATHRRARAFPRTRSTARRGVPRPACALPLPAFPRRRRRRPARAGSEPARSRSRSSSPASSSRGCAAREHVQIFAGDRPARAVGSDRRRAPRGVRLRIRVVAMLRVVRVGGYRLTAEPRRELARFHQRAEHFRWRCSDAPRRPDDPRRLGG